MISLQVYIASNIVSFIFGAVAAAVLLLGRNKSSLPEYKGTGVDWRPILAEFEATKPKDYEKRK